ncbi:11644_t:CDS:2 [Rhizophagus irregularis]|nr:11644_t:CDS:2 [Rhizophagus irregularis]
MTKVTAFLGVHSFPVFGGISYFFTQYFHCRDKTTVCNANNPIYYAGVGLLVALVVIFQLLHTLYVYLIWKKRIWPLVYEFKHSRHDEIKGMHATYEVQFPLFHAQTMMIGLWLVAYLTGVIVPFNIIFLYYSFFMLKGVRDEKRYLMYIVYVGNVIQAIFLYLDLESYCKKYAFIKKLDSPLQCLQYNMRVYVGLFWHYQHGTPLGVIKISIKICQHIVLTYEPAPPEFKTGRKFVKRESNFKAKFF